MSHEQSTVVRREVTVAAPIQQAFDVFTQRFDEVKPREHNLLASPIAETVFEPRVGGHIYDRAVDGSECRWARVLAFEPPHRVVFSWDIAPDWQLESDPENASEVEVTFTSVTDSQTLVRLEHRNIERHGPSWQNLADGIGGEQGWPLYLGRYTALFG